MKRGYSRQFTPSPLGHRRYLLDKIPAGLWDAARRKATKEGRSMRDVLLTALRQFIEVQP